MTSPFRPNNTHQSLLDVRSSSLGGVRHPALLLATIIAGGVLIVSQIYLAIPLSGPVSEEFGVSLRQAAWFGPSFGLAYAVGFLVTGALADRFGAARLLFLGLVAAAATTVLVTAVHGFWPLVIARALQGFAASAFPPAALTLISTALPVHLRARGASLMGFAFLCAAPLAQAAASWTVTVEVPVRLTLLVLAVGYGICAVGILLEKGQQGTRAPSESKLNASRSRLTVTRSLVATWCAASGVLFAFVSFYSAVTLNSADAGIDAQLVRLLGVLPLLVAFLVPSFVTRWGPLRVAGTGLIVAAVAVVASGLSSPIVILASSVVLPLGVGLAVPALIVSVAANTTENSRGKANAIYMLLLFGGASVGAPFTQTLFTYGATTFVWLIPALLLVVFAVVLFTASRPHRSAEVLK